MARLQLNCCWIIDTAALVRFASGGMKGSRQGNGLVILCGSLRAHSSPRRPNILTDVCRGSGCIWYQPRHRRRMCMWLFHIEWTTGFVYPRSSVNVARQSKKLIVLSPGARNFSPFQENVSETEKPQSTKSHQWQHSVASSIWAEWRFFAKKIG